MTDVTVDISISLDGFVAGPNATLEEPLGRGGERLHEWVVASAAWRESHGLEGGEGGTDSDLVEEHIASIGASIMGRRMFSGGEGPWDQDPNANGWWGDEPPFHHPVFVLTHHERAPLELTGTTFRFVTDGIESALEQAGSAAGDKDVHIAGGGEAVQGYLNAGVVDKIQLHVAPVLLGDGVRLFDDLSTGEVTLEPTRVIHSGAATHLRYRVVR
ncbi:MAG: dihydrofolate reductase family protein [Actinomycetota bacterium]